MFNEFSGIECSGCMIGRQLQKNGWDVQEKRKRRKSAANIGALARQVDTPGPLFSKTCLANVWVT